jgi:hypothetical protein
MGAVHFLAKAYVYATIILTFVSHRPDHGSSDT